VVPPGPRPLTSDQIRFYSESGSCAPRAAAAGAGAGRAWQYTDSRYERDVDVGVEQWAKAKICYGVGKPVVKRRKRGWASRADYMRDYRARHAYPKRPEWATHNWVPVSCCGVCFCSPCCCAYFGPRARKLKEPGPNY